MIALISTQDNFSQYKKKHSHPLSLHFQNPLFNISHCQWRLPPAKWRVGLLISGMQWRSVIEHAPHGVHIWWPDMLQDT